MAINAYEWIIEKLDRFDMMELDKCKTTEDAVMLAHNSFLLNGIIDSCFKARIFPEVVESKEELKEILDKILVLSDGLIVYFRIYFKHQQELADSANEEVVDGQE